MLEIATAALGGVMGILTDTVSKVGEMLVYAFTNPKEAIVGFATTIKEYVMDKVTAIMDGLGMLGNAIKAVFEGDFAKAASLAGDGLQKIYIEGSPAIDMFKAMGSAVKDFGNNVVDAATKASQLAKDAIALRKAQRELSVEFSEQRAIIEELKMASDDVTKSMDERIDAARKAGALEESLAKKREEQAEEAIRIQKEQMALSNRPRRTTRSWQSSRLRSIKHGKKRRRCKQNLMTKLNALEMEREAKRQERIQKEKDDAQALADLEAELALERMNAQEKEEQGARDLAKQRIERAKGDAELIKQIEEQLEADLLAIDERFQAEKDAKDEERKQKEIEEKQALKEALATEEELEMMALEAEYTAKLELARKYGEGEAELEKEFADKKHEINEKYRKQEKDARDKAIDDENAARTQMLLKTLDFASQALSILQGFNESANDEDEKTAKERFKRGKKIQKAGVIASTASAVIAALAAPPVGLGFPAGLAGAATAAASGALQIRKINQMQFESSSDDSVDEPSTSASSARGGGFTPPDLTSTIGEGLLPQNFAPSSTSPSGGDDASSGTIRAYVVSQEVSNAQQLDTELANTATL